MYNMYKSFTKAKRLHKKIQMLTHNYDIEKMFASKTFFDNPQFCAQSMTENSIQK